MKRDTGNRALHTYILSKNTDSLAKAKINAKRAKVSA